jgi:hypothetical protein
MHCDFKQLNCRCIEGDELAKHVAHMVEMRVTYRNVIVKPEGQKLHGRPKR